MPSLLNTANHQYPLKTALASKAYNITLPTQITDSSLSQIETELRKGNGSWILTRLTIRGVPVARLISVPLCLSRTGLRFQFMPVRKTILCKELEHEVFSSLWYG